MLTDQKELDALLSEADELAADAAADLTAPDSPVPSPHAPDRPASAKLARIRKIRVPLIVQLARRSMRIANVRDFSVGAIIEFEKSVEDDLSLLANNRLIGRGRCVKVGEHFGLRITQICDPAQRVRSLGAP